MARITEQQRRVYEFICQTLEEKHRPPMVREITEAMGYQSDLSSTRHIDSLCRLGLLAPEVSGGRRLYKVPAATVTIDWDRTPDGVVIDWDRRPG